jgi:LPXTG-motif cell wall-anchored protein
LSSILNPNNITRHASNTTLAATPLESSAKVGLSGGVKAAIGAVIGVFVLALVIGGLLFYRRRKNSSRGTEARERGELNGEQSPQEMSTVKNHREMSSNPVGEVPELETEENAVEMLADVPKWK